MWQEHQGYTDQFKQFTKMALLDTLSYIYSTIQNDSFPSCSSGFYKWPYFAFVFNFFFLHYLSFGSSWKQILRCVCPNIACDLDSIFTMRWPHLNSHSFHFQKTFFKRTLSLGLLTFIFVRFEIRLSECQQCVYNVLLHLKDIKRRHMYIQCLSTAQCSCPNG